MLGFEWLLSFKTQLLKQSNNKWKYSRDQIIFVTMEVFIELKDNDYAWKQK